MLTTRNVLKTMIIIFFWVTPVFAQAPYVLTGEKEVFSFTTEKGKRMTICTGTADDGGRYLVYRFGKKAAVEFEYPAARERSFEKFTYSFYMRGGGPGNEGLDLNYLIFENEGTKYTVYEEYYAAAAGTSAGIRVLLKGRKKEVDIKAKPGSIKGSLFPLRTDEAVRKAEMTE